MAFYNSFTRDNIVNGGPSRVSPPSSAIEITPSDTTIYDPPLRGISVREAANVAVLTVAENNEGGTNAVIIPVPAGQIKPLYIVKVLETGTDSGAEILGYR